MYVQLRSDSERLLQEFRESFSSFTISKFNFSLFANSLSFEVFCVPDAHQLKLIDLQDIPILMYKFNELSLLESHETLKPFRPSSRFQSYEAQ